MTLFSAIRLFKGIIPAMASLVMAAKVYLLIRRSGFADRVRWSLTTVLLVHQ